MKPAILIGHLKFDKNGGAIIRSAEAFGINLIFSLDRNINLNASQGSDKNVIIMYFDTIDELIIYLKMNNFSIVCIENTSDAKNINEIKKYPSNPVFIIGNENNGVLTEFLRNAKLIVKIPQAEGSYVRCLNTSSAGSIVLYDWYIKNRQQRNYGWKNE